MASNQAVHAHFVGMCPGSERLLGAYLSRYEG